MAFSLVEVTIALGIAGFCLLAILGLLQSGLTTERATIEQTAATGIMSSVFADLDATPSTTNTSKAFGLSFPNSAGATQVLFFNDAGQHSTSFGPDSRYRAVVQVDPIARGARVVAARAAIVISWPASANVSPTGWPTNQSGTVEVVTTIPRN